LYQVYEGFEQLGFGGLVFSFCQFLAIVKLLQKMLLNLKVLKNEAKSNNLNNFTKVQFKYLIHLAQLPSFVIDVIKSLKWQSYRGKRLNWIIY
jgi:hypothetical protein